MLYAEKPRVHLHLHIGVQLGQLGRHHLCPYRAHVLLRQIEVGAQVPPRYTVYLYYDILMLYY